MLGVNEKTTFVNRYKIINLLKEDINNNSEKKIFFLSSNSGVGKSRLSEEILKDVVHNISTVKLKISNSKAYSSQDGFYIKELAKAISKNTNNKLSFETFLLENVEEEDINRFLYKVAKDYLSKNSVFKNLKDVYEKLFQKGSFEEDKIFNTNLSESIHYSLKYIKFCVKKEYFVINIENIQNIDITSINCLKEIINESKIIYFLFEYTLNTPSIWITINELERVLCSELENINIDYKELEYLHLHDLKKILQSNEDALNQYISNSYKNWNGNLRPLVDIHFKLSNNQPSDVGNYVLNAKHDLNHFELNDLVSLEDNKLFLLQLISTHSDPVDFHLLNKIYYTNEDYVLYELNLDLEELKNRRFINEYNSLYFINDDSIESSLQTFTTFNIARTQSMDYWLRLYESLYKENNAFISRSQILYYILDFSVKLNKDDSLLKIIDELFFLFKNSTYVWIDTWVNKIFSLVKNVEHKSIKNMILIRLSEIMQNLGFSNWAYTIINDISTLSTAILIRKAILLEDLSRPNESMKILNSISTKDTNESLFLYKKAIEIACHRSMNNYKEAKKVFFKVMKKNSSSKEFAFILRQAGFILEEKESLSYLEKSISIFKKNALVVQETHSIIALAFVYIKLKNYTKAEEELLEAKKLIKDDFIEEYIILNNLATINIYKKQNLEETLKSLKNILPSVQLPFDRLTIHINILLIFALLKKEYKAIQKQFITIDKLCQKDQPGVVT